VPVIEARELTKVFRRAVKDEGLRGSLRHLVRRQFGEHVAVDRLNLTIEPGEAVAYVGPNGAGKSTTIKMLTGIVVPTSGDVRVGGLVPSQDRMANARQIGVLFGQRTQLWWDLQVRDSLSLLADMHGLSRAERVTRLALFDDVLKLGELLPVQARKLSLGQRMRADLAATLLHAPRIVYLDEPTIGLDISVKDEVRAFLRGLVADGVTLMLTTHDLGDIEDVCERLVIIDEGKGIYDGSLAGVKDRFARERTVLAQASGPVDVQALAARLPSATVTPVPGAAGEPPAGVSVTFDRFAASAGQVIAEISAAVAAGAEIIEIGIDEPKIEDVVRKVYAGQLDLTGGPV